MRKPGVHEFKTTNTDKEIHFLHLALGAVVGARPGHKKTYMKKSCAYNRPDSELFLASLQNASKHKDKSHTEAPACLVCAALGRRCLCI